MRIWTFGDDIDSDQIISGRYLGCADSRELARHVFAAVRPELAKEVNAGDILVAGSNFGCGSSREQAAQALKGAGFACIIAKGFARIFFRNCINIGLPIAIIDQAAVIEAGDEIMVDLSQGRIANKTKQTEYVAEPMPDFIASIIQAGGIIPYAKKLARR